MSSYRYWRWFAGRELVIFSHYPRAAYRLSKVTTEIVNQNYKFARQSDEGGTVLTLRTTFIPRIYRSNWFTWVEFNFLRWKVLRVWVGNISTNVSWRWSTSSWVASGWMDHTLNATIVDEPGGFTDCWTWGQTHWGLRLVATRPFKLGIIEYQTDEAAAFTAFPKMTPTTFPTHDSSRFIDVQSRLFRKVWFNACFYGFIPLNWVINVGIIWINYVTV